MKGSQSKIGLKALLAGIVFALALGLAAESAMFGLEEWLTRTVWPNWLDLWPIWRCALLLLGAGLCASTAAGLGGFALWLDRRSEEWWSRLAQLLLVMILGVLLVWALECLLTLADTVATDQGWTALDTAAQAEWRWAGIAAAILVALAAGLFAHCQNVSDSDSAVRVGRGTHKMQPPPAPKMGKS